MDIHTSVWGGICSLANAHWDKIVFFSKSTKPPWRIPSSNLISTETFFNVLTDFDLFWFPLMHFSAFWSIWINVFTFRQVLKHFGMCQYISIHFDSFRYVLIHFDTIGIVSLSHINFLFLFRSFIFISLTTDQSFHTCCWP